MRNLSFIFLVLLSCFSGDAQTYEAGLFFGGSNYIGDVGDTRFVAPSEPVVGAILKWNRSNRHAFRLTYLLGEILGDDLTSKDTRRLQRGYQFTNSMSELSIGIEYTFWEFDLHAGASAVTPYMYTGLTYTWYDKLKRTGSLIEPVGREKTMAIPMILGIKKTLGEHFIIAAEVGARYAFTDGLDGSTNVGGSTVNNVSFGNTNNNDWYVFSGLSLTYSFGRKPCYCNF